MDLFFVSGLLGWVASTLLGIESLLPYLLRRTKFSEWLGTSDPTKPYLQRMRIHFWLGYALLPLALLHAWLPMAAGRARGANMLGLWLATAALVLLFVQLGFGLSRRGANPAHRSAIRVTHFWTMTAIAAAAAVHIWLNG